MPSHRTYPVQVSPICPATDNTQSQVHSIRPAKEHTQSHFSSHMDHRRTFSVLPFHSTWPAEEHTQSHISSHMASRRTSLSHCSRCHAHKITVHLHHDVDVHPHHLHVQYPALRPAGRPPCSPPLQVTQLLLHRLQEVR